MHAGSWAVDLCSIHRRWTKDFGLLYLQFSALPFVSREFELLLLAPAVRCLEEATSVLAVASLSHKLYQSVPKKSGLCS